MPKLDETTQAIPLDPCFGNLAIDDPIETDKVRGQRPARSREWPDRPTLRAAKARTTDLLCSLVMVFAGAEGRPCVESLWNLHVSPLCRVWRPGALTQKTAYKITETQLECRLEGALTRIIKARVRNELEDPCPGCL